jgi:hypothetical protein
MNVPATPFLTRPELAERWEMAATTLENWAVLKKGPAPKRFGRRVLYRLADIEAYESKVFGDWDEADTKPKTKVARSRAKRSA